MVLSDTVSSVFAQVAPLLAGAEIAASDDGLRWHLRLSEGQEIFAKLDEGREALVLSTAIGAPPAGRSDGLARYLLQVNFAWAESGGLRLAMDSADPAEVHLLWELPLGGLGAHDMHAAIAIFSGKAKALRKLVADGGPGAPGGGPDRPGDAPDPGTDPHMLRV